MAVLHPHAIEVTVRQEADGRYTYTSAPNYQEQYARLPSDQEIEYLNNSYRDYINAIDIERHTVPGGHENAMAFDEETQRQMHELMARLSNHELRTRLEPLMYELNPNSSIPSSAMWTREYLTEKQERGLIYKTMKELRWNALRDSKSRAAGNSLNDKMTFSHNLAMLKISQDELVKLIPTYEEFLSYEQTDYDTTLVD